MSTSKFLSYAECSKWAIKQGITSSGDWKKLGKKRPANVPSEPWNTYVKNGEIKKFDWKKFLTPEQDTSSSKSENELEAKLPKKDVTVIDVPEKGYFTLAEAMTAVPAIGTETKHAKLSKKYQSINTSKVIENIQKTDSNWKIVHVRGTRLRDDKLQKFTHHVVKLENDKFVMKGGDRIQIIISNSHNGVSKFEFFFGIFKRVCSNGLVVSDIRFNGINKKHFTSYEDINTYIVECVTRTKELIGSVDQFKERILTKKEKLDLAVKALHARYQYKNSYLELMYDILKDKYDLEKLIEPMRDADHGDSLWLVFNVLQERITKGEYWAKTPTGLSKANPIKNNHCELQFNKKLWEYANEFIETKEKK